MTATCKTTARDGLTPDGIDAGVLPLVEPGHDITDSLCTAVYAFQTCTYSLSSALSKRSVRFRMWPRARGDVG
jgi:hypothetical protein